MKAFLIIPDTQAIEDVEVDGMDDIRTLVGFDSLESDAVGDDGDRLYFDEECFIRGTSGRFQIDSLIPDPEEVEELVTDQLAGTSLFAGLFRENAVRSLLLRRRRPGQRSPRSQTCVSAPVLNKVRCVSRCFCG